jgi:hypothetical protein
MTSSRQLTARQAVNMVRGDELLLPSIQRSFVWDPKRIAHLFDSLMRGYPIGTLLVWKTVPGDHKALRFHRFHTAFDGIKGHGIAFRPKRTTPVLAVLDGQQRLTALNIGLRGSHRSSPQSNERWLYIDLDVDDAGAGSEGNRYSFEFRSFPGYEGDAWFEVSQALNLQSDPASLNRAMVDQEIEPNLQRRMVLKRLVEVVNLERVVSFDLVPKSKSLDEVLNIFARCNMGGTKLTYVDLLVSTASAKMRNLNPSTEFNRLRREIEKAGFDLTIDRIVKASLVLIGLDEPKFHVESLLRTSSMKKLEQHWRDIADSLLLAARLLHSFGLDSRTLVAENAIIPVASYAFLHRLPKGYVEGDQWEKDRQRVKAFVARTLLRRAYWTGAVDPVLVAAHKTIGKTSGKVFPLAALEKALKAPKSITVDDAWLDELSNLSYGDRRTRTLLTLLYPGSNAGPSDKDHIFPISAFTDSKLTAAKIPGNEREGLREVADRLPNLQLLSEVDNRTAKRATQPKEWLKGLGPTAKSRYSAQHVNLKTVPHHLKNVGDFWDRRRDRLRIDIDRLLRGPNR